MWVYDATLVRVIDGDTVVLRLEKTFRTDVDFGFYIVDSMQTTKSTVMSFRLAGIDTPETRGVDVATREAGLRARDELTRLLGLGALRATTYKPDKYGRWLVTIDVTTPDGTVIDVCRALLDGGFAVPYV